MFRVCIGTGLAPRWGFSVLWLLLFICLKPVNSVCTFCFGDASGCNGDQSTCPWFTGVAANVAAVAAGGAVMIKLESLLPARFLRVFTRPVLQTLGIVSSRPKGGAAFNFTDKSMGAIQDAVVGGIVSKDEAVREICDRLTVEESKESPNVNLCKQLERGLHVVQKATVRVASSDITEGAYLYVLATLSHTTCVEEMPFDLCVEISDETTSAPGTPGGSRRFAASLKRPKNAAQMFALLHQFQLVAVTAGLTNLTSIGPFLEDAVYEPVRLGSLEWPVAFELMICYIRMVENEPLQWRLSNVISGSGGMDAKRAEALSIARGLYPASCFRRNRGEPREVGGGPRSGPQNRDEKPFTGIVKGDNPESGKGCRSWNLGNAHLAKYVDAATGCCVFKHACDQYVTDKGPNGQCLRDHKRKMCDYDKSKQCTTPQK